MEQEIEFDLGRLIAATMDEHSRFDMEMSSSPAAAPEVVTRPISKRRGKKRSSRACTSCRARKVRCNIVAHGAPCSNCRHDEIDCVLPLSRRQRSARERLEASLRANSTIGSEAGERRSGTVDFDNCSTSQHDDMSIYQDRQWERAQSQELGPHGMPISEHPLSEILPQSVISPPQAQSSDIPPTSSRTKSWIQIQLPLASAPAPKTSEARPLRLPHVFTAFPQHLGIADLLYLHSRDALTVPSDTLQIEILKAYVDFVHGSMPILDLEEFLSAVKYGESLDGQQGRGIEREKAMKKQIPFVLFQAVMFAGVGYVSMSALRNAGYHNRETAKRVLFNRVRLCYDFDTCTDRQSIIQSLLLMTQSTPPPTHDGKDAWHWLGLAISLSYSLGLNRSATPNNTRRKKRLERRIWWTTFVRDRTLALAPGGTWARAVRIRREDCDVEMLSLSDFDLSPELSNDEEDERVEDVRTRQRALECVEKAMLCWSSSDTLITSVHQLRHSNTQAQRAPNPIFIPQSNMRGLEVDQGQEPYTASSYTSAPIFEAPEDREYRMASSSSPSVPSDCPTPLSEPVFQQPTLSYIKPEFISGSLNGVDLKALVNSSLLIPRDELEAGYGVDGEYDDYMEYLRPAAGVSVDERLGERVEKKRKETGRETWAFQLDCENERILEV